MSEERTGAEMKLISESYGHDWIFVCETADGRRIEVKYNPRTDGAKTTALGRGVTASMRELNKACDLARPLIIEHLDA